MKIGIGTKNVKKQFENPFTTDEVLQQAEFKEIVERLGDSLIIIGDSESTREHLRDLTKLPQKLIEVMRERGLKIVVGKGDYPTLLSEIKGMKAFWERLVIKFRPPKGWEDTPTKWKGVPGAYFRILKTVFAGEGEHGSESLILHEYGHAVGSLLELNTSKILEEAHIRLYPTLEYFFQQGEPGNEDGRDELLGESFAEYFMIPREEFILRYDEQLYLFWEQTLANV